jgi:hypothetical protein
MTQIPKKEKRKKKYDLQHTLMKRKGRGQAFEE